MKKECRVRRARAFGQNFAVNYFFFWLVFFSFHLCVGLFFSVNLVFLDGFLFDLLYLSQYFLDDHFANAMTTDSRKHCSTQNGQIAEEKVINGRSNVCKRNKTTSSSQIILWKKFNDKKKLEYKQRKWRREKIHIEFEIRSWFALQDKSFFSHRHIRW